MDDALREKELQQRFLIHRADLVQKMHPIDALDYMTDLFPAGFDTYQEIAEVQGIGRNERSRRLLNALVTRGITGYKRMIRALCHSGQKDLAVLIAKDLYPELLEEPIQRDTPDGPASAVKLVKQSKPSGFTPSSSVSCLLEQRSEAVFNEVCKRLNAKDSLVRTWPALLEKTGLSFTVEDFRDCLDNPTEVLIKVWLAEQGGEQATVGVLLRFLFEIGRRDCVDPINELLVTKWEVPGTDDSKTYPAEPTEDDLYKLAEELGKDTQVLAEYLGVGYSTVKNCLDENPSNIIKASREMLIKWKQKEAGKAGKAGCSFDTIFAQLKKMDQISLINKFKKLLDARC